MSLRFLLGKSHAPRRPDHHALWDTLGERVRRRSSVALLIACAFALATGAGCGADKEALHAAADSLVPESSRILAREEGDCVQLGASPSCVELFVAAPSISQNDYIEFIRERASEEDWGDPYDVDASGRGATWLWFRKDDYTAIVRVVPDPSADTCGGRPSCANTIKVIRGG